MSASQDRTIKVVDFKAEKIIHTAETPDRPHKSLLKNFHYSY